VHAIREAIDDNPDSWSHPYEYFWGNQIIEFLKTNEFEEFIPDYIKLVEEAVNR
jgi:hypothetical protein